ncbi:GNAT family N-acetyltransferase [Roseisolibacter sp. H3M3-2]|uniref:GNAT family N-acetyltransferase n=1 Tax=Roseisolibacter sp. H3M3-2 TaxID=3031323 RepID=UPI0023D9D586|nr:GNAT family N-acetyltransferase [Roseisolibacter sp. H3M3-2]MDF1503066.1 GNAT family N-acetyltransferase [Roseisolibacter sp. H3M3-2]
MSVAVRPATAADLPAIAALARDAQAMHEAALPARYQPPDAAAPAIAGDLARVLTAPAALLLVAGRAVAASVGYPHVEEQRAPASAYARASAALHLEAMAVDPAGRSRGVGRALLAAARAEAKARGLARITLDVYAFNARARAFYAREGFAPVRERMEGEV